VVTIEDLLHRRSDLSTFIVHFTRDGADSSAHDNLMSILRRQRLQAQNPFGMAKDLAQQCPAVVNRQRTVCFTETPLEHAWMMCQDIESRDVRFTGHGLAFTRTFARRAGANPVWYLDMTKPPQDSEISHERGQPTRRRRRKARHRSKWNSGLRPVGTSTDLASHPVPRADGQPGYGAQGVLVGA